MMNCVESARTRSYSSGATGNWSTQSRSPQSQTMCMSPSLTAAKPRLRSSMRSFTSRKSASLRPIRSIRSIRSWSVMAAEGLLSAEVMPNPARVRSTCGGLNLRRRRSYDRDGIGAWQRVFRAAPPDRSGRRRAAFFFGLLCGEVTLAGLGNDTALEAHAERLVRRRDGRHLLRAAARTELELALQQLFRLSPVSVRHRRLRGVGTAAIA